jgi:ADP-heptose:LPS heptosyltransferase
MRTEEIAQKELQLIWLPTGGHVGDATFVVALFAELIEKVPQIKILYVVRRNTKAIAELAQAYPSIIITPLPYAPVPALKAVLGLLKKRSIVIVPPARVIHPLVIKVLSALFVLRGDRVIGFHDTLRDPTKWHPYSKVIAYDHKARYIDNLRKSLALASLPTNPLGSPPQMKFMSATPDNFPFVGKPYFVIHAFGHMTTAKSIPIRRWRDLVAFLRKEYPSYGIVITGAEVDRLPAEEMARGHDNIFLAVGLSLLEIAGIIEHTKLYIGIDTGPTHIAGVLGVPSVILAHQHDPIWLPDYNPHAVMVWNKETCVCGIEGETCTVMEDGDPYRHCLYDLPDEAIQAAIRGIL